VLRVLLCTLGLLAAGAIPARAAVPVGLADQHDSALVDPQFSALGLRSARVVAAWDAALEPSPELDAWLRTAHTLGLDALVTFGPRRGEACQPGRCVLPSVDAMRAAFRAFRTRWPWVTAFGAWNEDNHTAQPTANAPSAAARLYEALADECPECRIIAAELLDIDNMLGWLRRFRGALSREPALWGLHNYGDVTRGRTAYTEALLGAVTGKVWVTETGGIVRSARWPYDEERARLGVVRALALADAHPDRIERVFIYQWRTAPWEPWDAGLLRPDGTPRPSYAALADYVGAPVPPTGVRLADGTRATPAAPPRITEAAARLVRRPRVNRRGVVSARVACPVAAARSCPARLSVRTRVFRGRRQPLGADAERIRPGTIATLSVRFPAARRRLIRLGRTTSVVARVQAGWHREFVLRFPR
jgi:hypothetical protein